MGQMGKWYSAVSDFRKGQSMQKKPPLFKKLFAAGSVEEEALALLIHEKKIMEMEKETGISPGQACVFYSKDSFGDKVLGGGWINKTLNNNLST